MKLIKLCIAFLLIGQLSYGQCKPVTYLTSGQNTPCNGYLFTPEKEAEVRDMVEKYPKLVELVTQQDKLVGQLTDQVLINKAISSNLKEQLDNKEKYDTIKNVLLFLAGVGAGIIAAKTIGK